jgi:hypothetical protein
LQGAPPAHIASPGPKVGKRSCRCTSVRAVYGEMLHESLAADGVRVVQLVIPGSIPKLQVANGADGVPERIWQLHDTGGFQNDAHPARGRAGVAPERTAPC